MCVLCKKAEFALDSLWMMVTTPELCDLIYEMINSHPEAGDEAKSNFLALIKRARAEEPKAIDEVRTVLLCNMIEHFVEHANVPGRILGTSFTVALQQGMMARMERLDNK